MKRLGTYTLLSFALALNLISIESKAQQTVEGYVYDDQEVAIPYAHILNLSAGQGTISGENGYFALPVSKGDTIRISFIGYSTLLIPMNEEMLARELEVLLRPDYIELPSIWVFANPKYMVPKRPIIPSMRMGPLPEYKNVDPVNPGDFVFKPFAATQPDGQKLPVLGPSITLYGPFTYLTKEEREKRKAEEAYLKTLETISFAKLMALHQTRELLKGRYDINDQELDQLIVKMNMEIPEVQTIKEPDRIFYSVDRFIGQKVSSAGFQAVRP